MGRVPTNFKEACALLQNHQRRQHTPEETLNRLFKKHLIGRPEILVGAPWLTEDNTELRIETKSKQEFVDLPLKQDGPGRDVDCPILIVRYRGVDCLLDGSHRCRAWRQSGDESEHAACVLEVVKEADVASRSDELTNQGQPIDSPKTRSSVH
jgi:hypothetical protein